MNYFPVQSSYFGAENFEKNCFCLAPFCQLTLQPTGVISPCCFAQEINLGNQNEEFENVWNGYELQKLRNEFISGTILTCKDKMSKIGCNKYFERFNNNIEINTVVKAMPILLDLRLNGSCNLSCIMCGVWKQPSGIYNNSVFWTKCKNEIIPQLKEIYMVGGEPFIQNDTFKLIDFVSEENKSCQWIFETNGNINFEKIREYLLKINVKRIGISIDSLSEKIYEKIRRKGDLYKVLENIEKFVAFRDKYRTDISPVEIELTMCVFEENYREIPALIDFCKCRDLKFHFHYINQPEELSMNRLSAKTRAEVISYLSENVSKVDLIKLLPIINSLKSEFNESENSKTLDDVLILDPDNKNWLVNADFKDDLQGWTIVGNIKVCEDEGRMAALIKGEDYQFRGIIQVIEIGKDVRKILLSGEMKTFDIKFLENSWQNSRITLEFLNSNDQVVGAYPPITGGAVGCTEWRKYSRIYPRHPQAEKVKVLFSQYCAKGISYFSNGSVVMLNEKDEAIKPDLST